MIERLFGTAKEIYKMKLGPTFAYLNMKKLAKIMANRDRRKAIFPIFG
jgi:hypothetical protein